MYTPYKAKEKKKLCPRDGTPLIEMTKGGKPAYYYCPICHYTKTLTEEEKEAEIKISEEAEEEEEEKELKVTIFQIREDPVKVDALDPDYVSIVIDRENDYLWIWKGSESSQNDMYNAGVQATKLKSSEKMYKAMVRRVEQDKEPVEFLILEIPVRKAKEIKEKKEEEVKEEVEEKVAEEPVKEEEVKEEVKEKVAEEPVKEEEVKEEVKEEVAEKPVKEEPAKEKTDEEASEEQAKGEVEKKESKSNEDIEEVW
ncbi:MAG: hypothetical protein GF329_07235 [Candidatus Lokiarchaeota archaeon]|nr:hypothetical protein [Candidatus Lokiarchaeota archaeon]